MAKPILMVVCVLVLASCLSVGTVTPLHEAVRDGDRTAAEQEASRGADVNAIDEEGRTPMHYVCANGDEELAEWLLGIGAEPNAQDSEGNTPLHYTASNCYSSIAAMLVSAGADANLVNQAGQKPIDIAREIECAETVTLLGPLTVE